MVMISNQANSGRPEDQWAEAHTLMYEVTGPSPASVQEQLAIVTRLAEQHQGFAVKVLTDCCRNPNAMSLLFFVQTMFLCHD